MIIEKMAYNRKSSNLGISPKENQADDLASEMSLRLEGMEDPFKESWVAV